MPPLIKPKHTHKRKKLYKIVLPIKKKVIKIIRKDYIKNSVKQKKQFIQKFFRLAYKKRHSYWRRTNKEWANIVTYWIGLLYKLNSLIRKIIRLDNLFLSKIIKLKTVTIRQAIYNFNLFINYDHFVRQNKSQQRIALNRFKVITRISNRKSKKFKKLRASILFVKTLQNNYKNRVKHHRKYLIKKTFCRNTQRMFYSTITAFIVLMRYGYFSLRVRQNKINRKNLFLTKVLQLAKNIKIFLYLYYINKLIIFPKTRKQRLQIEKMPTQFKKQQYTIFPIKISNSKLTLLGGSSEKTNNALFPTIFFSKNNIDIFRIEFLRIRLVHLYGIFRWFTISYKKFLLKNVNIKFLFATITPVFAKLMRWAASETDGLYATNRWLSGRISAFIKLPYAPHYIIIPDVDENVLILEEAFKKNIAVISITNSDNTQLADLPVFGNNRSFKNIVQFTRCITLFSKNKQKNKIFFKPIQRTRPWFSILSNISKN